MKTFMKSERSRTLILLTLAVVLYFFVNFQRTVVPGSIFSELQSDLNASAAAITGLGAAFMYIYAISQLFAGVLTDKFGGYRVITAGGFLFCIGALLFPFSHAAWMLYLSRAVVGIGASAIYLSMIKESQRAFPGNFASAMGIIMLIGYTGGMAANAPFVALVQKTGWRAGLMGAGIIMAVIWLLFLIFRLTLKMPAVTDTRFSIKAFVPAVNKRHNWALYILVGISFAVFYAFQTVIGKKFLEDYCGMSVLNAGWVLTLTGALSAIASFGIPFLSKFSGNRRKPFMLFMGIGTLFCTTAVLLALCIGFHDAWYFTSLFFLLTLCANMTPVYLALLSETNPSRNLGVCASFSNCLAYIFVALFGNISGVLMDIFGFRVVNGIRVYSVRSYIAVFILFTVLAGIGFLASLILKETKGNHIDVR